MTICGVEFLDYAVKTGVSRASGVSDTPQRNRNIGLLLSVNPTLSLDS